ncbi:hypothetical protein SDC9_194867 [bioreactor metagenome]|uniref:Uncharacterized protein n=1 Tax=bioreactor metagenome TaxID=1076179 RepID=A0A645I7G6_9ZZZZ
MNPTRESAAYAIGRKINAIEARIVPPIIYGILFPNFVFVLSDNHPNIGSMNKAKTLSIAIKTPTMY